MNTLTQNELDSILNDTKCENFKKSEYLSQSSINDLLKCAKTSNIDILSQDRINAILDDC